MLGCLFCLWYLPAFQTLRKLRAVSNLAAKLELLHRRGCLTENKCVILISFTVTSALRYLRSSHGLSDEIRF